MDYGVDLRMDTHKKRHHVFNRDWTTCSNFAINSRLNSQHNLGGGAK